MDTPNYQEIPFTGKKYKRAAQVIIDNGTDDYQKKITFNETEAIVSDDGSITMSTLFCDSCSLTMDITKDLHVQAYYILNQLYTEARELRDAERAAELGG